MGRPSLLVAYGWVLLLAIGTIAGVNAALSWSVATANTPMGPLIGCRMYTIGGTVFVHGGADSTPTANNNVWSSTNLTTWVRSGSFTTARAYHSVVYFPPVGKWVMLGGTTTPAAQNPSTFPQDVQVSNDGHTWNMVGTSGFAPPGVTQGCVVVYKSRLVSLYGSSTSATQPVWASDVNSLTNWIFIAQTTPMPAHIAHSCGVLDGTVFVWGGYVPNANPALGYGLNNVYSANQNLSIWTLRSSNPWANGKGYANALFLTSLSAGLPGYFVLGGVRDGSSGAMPDSYSTLDGVAMTPLPPIVTQDASAARAYGGATLFNIPPGTRSNVIGAGVVLVGGLLGGYALDVRVLTFACQTGVTCGPVAAGSCLDYNTTRCVCNNGYSGPTCAVLGYCASLPCANGGTCVMTNVTAGYCICTSDWTSNSTHPCGVDVNECATNNGGCGAYSACINAPGSFSCSVVFVPNSLNATVPPAMNASTDPSVPLVLSTTGGGQRLEFVLSAPGYAVTTFTGVLSPSVTDPYRLFCGLFAAVGPPTANNTLQRCRCQIAGIGGGRNLTFFVVGPGSVVLTQSPNRVWYPAPLLDANSLTLNRTGFQPNPMYELSLDTSVPVNVQFTGAYFTVDSRTVVTYGADGPLYDRYPCVLVLPLCTVKMITCTTAGGSQGTGLYFRVTVAGQSNVGVSPFILSFPTTPTVTNVTGCPVTSPDSRTTSNCPSEGGIPITITGTNLVQNALSVSVGGLTCEDAVAYGTRVVCTLPASNGGVDKSIVVTCTGQPSVPFVGVSYIAPSVTGITGCGGVDPLNQLLTYDCPTSGGTTLTLDGLNFGFSGGVVLVGSSPCTNLTHDADPNAHRRVFCELASGTGVDKAVTYLSAGGGIATSAVVSYVQCVPGTNITGLTCTPCPRGHISTTPNAAVCTACVNGTYTGVPDGGDMCLSCPAGTYSDAAASACTNCTAGMANPATNQPSCVACLPGTYSAMNASTECVACETGRYNPLPQQTTCIVALSGFVASANRLSATACGAGQFSATNGLAACQDCPIGMAGSIGVGTATESPGVGGYTSCVSCLPGTGTSFQSQTGSATCQFCSVDFYYRASTGQCEACPVGVRCSAAGVAAVDGFYVYYENNDQLKSIPCQPSFCRSTDSCTAPGAGFQNGSSSDATAITSRSCCADGRVASNANPLCGRCETGYTFSGGGAGACIACTETDSSVVVLLLVLTWAYVTLFHVLAQQSAADTRIFLNYSQFVYIFMSTQAGNLTNWLSIFNFNVFSSSGSTCVTPLTDLERLSTGIIVPLIGFGFLMINCLLNLTRWTCIRRGLCCPNSELATVTEWTQIVRPFRRTALGFTASSYPSIAQTVLSFFSCIRFGSESYVYAYPGVSCSTDSTYNAVYPLFVALMIVVVAFPLLVFARLQYLNRTGLLFGDADTRVVYGIYCDVYKPRAFAWEGFVLVRRLVVAAVILAPQFNTDITAKFTYLCLCCVVFSTIHLLVLPYQKLWDNHLETSAEVSLVVLSLFLTSAPNPLTAAYAGGLSALCFTIGAIFLSQIVYNRIERVRRCGVVVWKAITGNDCTDAGAGAGPRSPSVADKKAGSFASPPPPPPPASDKNSVTEQPSVVAVAATNSTAVEATVAAPADTGIELTGTTATGTVAALPAEPDQSFV